MAYLKLMDPPRAESYNLENRLLRLALDNDNFPIGRLQLLELIEASSAVVSRAVQIEKPMAMFYTADVRAGNEPSSIFDILGDALCAD